MGCPFECCQGQRQGQRCHLHDDYLAKQPDTGVAGSLGGSQQGLRAGLDSAPSFRASRDPNPSPPGFWDPVTAHGPLQLMTLPSTLFPSHHCRGMICTDWERSYFCPLRGRVPQQHLPSVPHSFASQCRKRFCRTGVPCHPAPPVPFSAHHHQLP